LLGIAPRSVAEGDHVGACAGIKEMISQVLPFVGFVDEEAEWILSPRLPPDEMKVKGRLRAATP
jgi:hypothetical protein